ncbi:uncharacterized protein LOC144158354 isoform X1 [Haemaphysalis longicornis]
MVWNDQEKCVDVVRPEKCVDAVRPEKHRVRRSRCTRCNTLHDDRACPAFGKTCFRCGKSNHFVARCPAKPKSRQSCCITATDQAGGKTASSCQEDTASDESSGEFDILDVGVCTIASRPEWIVTVGVGATGKLSLKVDTGSQANLLPYSLYRKLSKNASVRPSPATLRSYTGGIIKHIGLVTLQLKMNGTTAPVDFFVVKNGHQALLGLETSEKLSLVSRVDSVKEEDIVSQFPDVFSGTGFLGRPYHLTLREGAQPIVQPARRVPQALRTPLKSELDRMEKEGIIRKVPGPSEWYVPGSQLVLADTLSRQKAHIPREPNDLAVDIEVHATHVLFDLVAPTTLDKLVTETQHDPILQQEQETPASYRGAPRRHLERHRLQHSATAGNPQAARTQPASTEPRRWRPSCPILARGHHSYTTVTACSKEIDQTSKAPRQA